MHENDLLKSCCYEFHLCWKKTKRVPKQFQKLIREATTRDRFRHFTLIYHYNLNLPRNSSAIFSTCDGKLKSRAKISVKIYGGPNSYQVQVECPLICIITGFTFLRYPLIFVPRKQGMPFFTANFHRSDVMSYVLCSNIYNTWRL